MRQQAPQGAVRARQSYLRSTQRKPHTPGNLRDSQVVDVPEEKYRRRPRLKLFDGSLREIGNFACIEVCIQIRFVR